MFWFCFFLLKISLRFLTVRESCRRHTCVVWWTQTGVVAHAVHTGGAVLAAVVLTVVHVHLAEGAVESVRTRAAEAAHREQKSFMTS